MSFLRDYTVSLATIVEVALVGGLVAGVLFVSSSKAASSMAGGGGGGVGKKNKTKRKRKQVKDESPAADKEQDNAKATHQQPAPSPTPAATAPAPNPATKKKKGKAPAAPAPTPALAPAPSPIAPSSDAPSFAKVAAPSPPTSNTSLTPATKPKETAAEKALRPEPKVATSDMRDESIDPTPQAARVMKVVGGKLGAGAKEPEPEPWGDDGWEKHEDEGDWEVAKPVKKPTRSIGGSSASSSAFAASNPAPARSIPGLPSAAHSTQANKNAKAKAKAAAMKEDAERERLQRLAEHRKGLERARMLEQEAMRNKGKPKTGPRSERFSTASPEPKYKPKSGGMTASLDSDSNLIWE